MYVGWYEVTIHSDWLYNCYNVSFDFPGSDVGNFELSGCIGWFGWAHDRAVFNLPRSKVEPRNYRT